MKWHELYPQGNPPEAAQISAYIANPLWEKLISFLEQAYHVQPLMQYSKCSMDPGWNIKYRKGSVPICTLYPRAGYFTCLVVARDRDAVENEGILRQSPVLWAQYQAARPWNGTRWLMIDVNSPEVLTLVKALLAVRVPSRKK